MLFDYTLTDNDTNAMWFVFMDKIICADYHMLVSKSFTD
jgi:hypothetical protein